MYVLLVVSQLAFRRFVLKGLRSLVKKLKAFQRLNYGNKKPKTGHM